MMILSTCGVCNSKKSRFIKKQKVNVLLLAPSLPFSRMPLIVSIL